jgi:Tfp pilus assembly protein PilO
MTNKNKNILLLFGFFLVLIVCYKLALSKTFEQRDKYENLQQEVILFKNAPLQLTNLKQKNVYFDSILTKNKLAGSSIQNNLLKVLNANAAANSLEIINFLEPHIFEKNELKIKTYEFTVEGAYANIINLIYQLEQKTRFGEIIHVSFEKKKNFRTGTSYLQARILIRNLN